MQKAPDYLLRGTVMDHTATAPAKQVTALAVPLAIYSHMYKHEMCLVDTHILTAV